MKLKILISLLLLNGCAFMNSYQPMNVQCDGNQMHVVEYTRMCEKDTYQSWQSCSAQAERLFCQNPDWKGLNK
jgi:hypothetical protein